MYAALKNKKNEELNRVNNLILNSLSLELVELKEFLSDFLISNSKKLRPLFIFYICDLLKIKLTDDVFNMACAIELLHSASLIHDDILDNGQIRRSKPCIHLKYGNKTAVLAGDYVLTLAMEFVSKFKNNKCMEILSQAGMKMTKSELMSLDMRFKKPSLEFYIQTLKEKTSTLFIASIECLEEISNKKIDFKIYEFAENFSLCFQLKDDISNYLNEDVNKISSDEKEGIYTLPVILNSYGIIDNGRSFLNDLVLKTEQIISDYSNSKDLKELTKCLRVK